jgi:hypothetical protein
MLTKATFRAVYDLDSTGMVRDIQFVHASCNTGRFPYRAYWSDLSTLYTKPGSLVTKAKIYNAIQAFGGTVAA